MKKGMAICATVSAIFLPLIPLLYLYNRNAQYLSGYQMLAVGGAMMVVSLLGYLLLRWIFRSRTGGLLGCTMAWVLFYGYGGLYDFLVSQRHMVGLRQFLLIYGIVAIVLILGISFLLRKREAPRLCAMATIFLGVLLCMNAVPAAGILIKGRQPVDTAAVKTQFAVDEDTSSPNVYWLHLDGMLGFDAYERYFGDDQAEFKSALAQRGFMINEHAWLEANHTTKIAVPALMCPAYYDEVLSPVLKDHQTARAYANIDYLSKDQLQYACFNNETRRAFEEKGYLSQTIGAMNIYYPPVSDRQYMTSDSRGNYILQPGSDFKDRYLDVIEAGELAILLANIPSNTFFNAVVKLSQRGLLPFRLNPIPLAHETDRFTEMPVTRDRFLLESLYDATFADQPAFTIVFDLAAHTPFTLNEDGSAHGEDPEDILRYAGQHRYAVSVLMKAVDVILERDPDAVIVLQADHGLHGQSGESIAAAFGEEAIEPIWNQVMSAVRIPQAYAAQDFAAVFDNPLNISRYLVNTFVGENYEYVN